MATETAPKRQGRVLRIALIASLAVNLLIVGLVAGAFLSGGPKTTRGVGGGPGGFSPLARALEEEDRRATRAALRSRGKALRASRQGDRQDLQRVLAALRADPMDLSTIETIFAAQRTRAADRIEIGQAVLLERSQAMTPGERQAYADRVEGELAKGPRRKGPRDGGP